MFFSETAMVSAYAWNAMPIDGADIIRSIPAIGFILCFPMDVALDQLPMPECSTAKESVSYIHQIGSGSRLTSEIKTWIVEKYYKWHMERIDSNKTLYSTK